MTDSVQSLVCHNTEERREERVMRRRRQEMSAHVRSEQLQLTGSAIRYRGGAGGPDSGHTAGGGTLIWEGCAESGRDGECYITLALASIDAHLI